MNALPWHGGKFFQRKWINEILGKRSGSGADVYCEPFFGMGSVLLARDPSPIEIVSDKNDRVVNWWRVLQTQTDELAEAIACVPSSRSLFQQAQKLLDEGTAIDRAVSFHIVVTQGFYAADTPDSWKPKQNPPWLSFGYADKLRKIALRVRKVNIDNRCGTDVLKLMRNKNTSIVYCDPPYSGTKVSPYGIDGELELTELLLAQKGRCAISGYDSQWNHLGWSRHVFETPLRGRNIRPKQKRTEVLWVNGK